MSVDMDMELQCFLADADADADKDEEGGLSRFSDPCAASAYAQVLRWG